MKLKQMKGALSSAKGNVAIQGVPSHFHITEIGKTTKSFLDCGGVKRQSEVCTLQTYTDVDFDHRISTDKFLAILEMAKDLDINDDTEVEIEIQSETVAIYALGETIETNNELLFTTKRKKTACLSPDKCGLDNPVSQSCCGGTQCCGER